MRSWAIRCGVLYTPLHKFFTHLNPLRRSVFTVVLLAIGTACLPATNACAQASQNARLTVLVFHDIQASEDAPSNPMVVRMSLFKKQMQYGLKSVSEVLPILAEHRFKASFALVPGMVGVYPSMGWAEISKVFSNPQYDVLSHTMTHHCPTFAAYDGSPGKAGEKAEYELSESRRIISEKAGKQITALVWPCATVSSASVKLAVRLGYTSIFVTDGQSNYAGSGNRQNIHRIAISGYCSMNEFVRTVTDGVGFACSPPKAN